MATVIEGASVEGNSAPRPTVIDQALSDADKGPTALEVGFRMAQVESLHPQTQRIEEALFSQPGEVISDVSGAWTPIEQKTAHYLDRVYATEKDQIDLALVVGDKYFNRLRHGSKLTYLQSRSQAFSALPSPMQDLMVSDLEMQASDRRARYAWSRSHGGTFLNSAGPPPAEFEKGRGFVGGVVAGLESGAVGLAQSGQSLYHMGGQALNRLSGMPAPDPNPDWAKPDFLERLQQSDVLRPKGEARLDRPLGGKLSDPAWWGRALGEAIPIIVGGAIAEATTDGAATFPFMASVAAGGHYRGTIAKGVDPDTAAKEAVVVGIINGLIYSVIPKSLAKLAGEGTTGTSAALRAIRATAAKRILPVLNKAVKEGGVVGGSMGAASAVEMLADKLGHGENTPWKEAATRLVEASIKGAALGVMSGGAIEGTKQAALHLATRGARESYESAQAIEADRAKLAEEAGSAGEFQRTLDANAEAAREVEKANADIDQQVADEGGEAAPPEAATQPTQEQTVEPVEAATEAPPAAKATPPVRKNAEEVGVPVEDVEGSGRKGYATGADVEQAAGPHSIGGEVDIHVGNRVLPARYEVWPLGKLQASHDLAGRDNPDYPAELQQRQRGWSGSSKWVQATAAHLNPGLLGESVEPTTGAPMVGKDFSVESGNGRVLAIEQAYNTAKGNAYQTWLVRNADRFGLDASIIADMGKPVLVRRRTTDLDPATRVEVARDANVAATERLSSTEQALTDAEKITAAALSLLQPLKSGFSISANNPFVQFFMGAVVPESERAAMMTPDGSELNSDGLRRLHGAVLARVYGTGPRGMADSDVTTARLNAMISMTETGGRSESIANIVNALVRAAGRISMVRARIESGRLALSHDMGRIVAEAVEVLRHGPTVADKRHGTLLSGTRTFLDTPSLFGDTWSDAAKMVALYMAENNRSARAISSMLDTASGQLLRPEFDRTQSRLAGMDGDTPPLDRIIGWSIKRVSGDTQEDLFSHLDAQDAKVDRALVAGESDPLVQKPAAPEHSPKPDAHTDVDSGDGTEFDGEFGPTLLHSGLPLIPQSADNPAVDQARASATDPDVLAFEDMLRTEEHAKPKASDRNAVQRAFDRWRERWWDVSGTTKAALRKHGALGQIAAMLLDLVRGSSARAIMMQEEASLSIYSQIPARSEQNLLAGVLQAVGTIEADEAVKTRRARQARSKEAGNRGQGALWTEEQMGAFEDALKNPLGTTVEQATKWLEHTQRTQDAGTWKRVVRAAHKYWGWQRRVLDRLHAEGLLGDEAYAFLAKHHRHYHPRQFIQHLDPASYQQVAGGGRVSVGDSGIRALDEGSVSLLVNKPMFLLAQGITRAEARIGRNRAAKAALALAEEAPKNGVVRSARVVGVRKTGQPVYANPPHGWQRIWAMRDGRPHAMDMIDDVARGWVKSDPQINHQLANTVRLLTGTKLVKALATGINPAFALTNVPRDMALIFLQSNTGYSHFLPKFLAQTAWDIGTVFPDVILRKGRVRDYVMEGGGMEFLVHQGRIMDPHALHEGLVNPSPYSLAMERAQAAAGWIGETSELITRMALRERALKNGHTPEEATWIARNYLDFAQGGSWAKALDTAVPYFNASVQGLRSAVRAAKQKPGLFAWKIAQIATVSMGVTLANVMNFGPLLRQIPDDIRNRYFCFIYGTTTDENGVKRPRYLTIPKPDTVQPFFTFFDTLMEKYLTGENNFARMKGAAWQAAQWVPGANAPPVVSAALAYFGNLDVWQWDRVWKGGDVTASAEYSRYTNPAWVKLGQLTGASPERLSRAVSKMVPTYNPFVQQVSWAARGLFGAAPEQDADKMHKRMLLDVTGLRRMLRVGLPEAEKERKTMHDAQLAHNAQQHRNNVHLDRLFAGEGGDAAAMEWVRSVSDSAEQRRLYRRLIRKGRTEGLSPYWLNLAEMSPAPRALTFYHKWLQTPEAQRDDLMRQAAKVPGLWTREFAVAFTKLRRRAE